MNFYFDQFFKLNFKHKIFLGLFLFNLIIWSDYFKDCYDKSFSVAASNNLEVKLVCDTFHNWDSRKKSKEQALDGKVAIVFFSSVHNHKNLKNKIKYDKKHGFQFFKDLNNPFRWSAISASIAKFTLKNRPVRGPPTIS